MSAETRVAACPSWCNDEEETHAENIHATDWSGPAGTDGEWQALSRAVEDGISGITAVELAVTDGLGTEVLISLTPDQADDLADWLRSHALEARE